MLEESLSQVVVRVPKALILFSQDLGRRMNILVLLELFYLFPCLQLGRHINLVWPSRSSTNSPLISHWTYFFLFFLLRPCASAKITHSPTPIPLLTPTSKPVIEYRLLSPRMLSSRPLLPSLPSKPSCLKPFPPKRLSLLTPTNWDDFFAPFHLTI